MSPAKRTKLDDLALLEDLEKQRVLIKAELDSELMEGKVQSGMGFILQDYESGSEEKGEIHERQEMEIDLVLDLQVQRGNLNCGQ